MYEKPNYGMKEVIFSTAVFHDKECEYMNENLNVVLRFHVQLRNYILYPILYFTCSAELH